MGLYSNKSPYTPDTVAVEAERPELTFQFKPRKTPPQYGIGSFTPVIADALSTVQPDVELKPAGEIPKGADVIEQKPKKGLLTTPYMERKIHDFYMSDKQGYASALAAIEDFLPGLPGVDLWPSPPDQLGDPESQTFRDIANVGSGIAGFGVGLGAGYRGLSYLYNNPWAFWQGISRGAQALKPILTQKSIKPYVARGVGRIATNLIHPLGYNDPIKSMGESMGIYTPQQGFMGSKLPGGLYRGMKSVMKDQPLYKKDYALVLREYPYRKFWGLKPRMPKEMGGSRDAMLYGYRGEDYFGREYSNLYNAWNSRKGGLMASINPNHPIGKTLLDDVLGAVPTGSKLYHPLFGDFGRKVRLLDKPYGANLQDRGEDLFKRWYREVRKSPGVYPHWEKGLPYSEAAARYGYNVYGDVRYSDVWDFAIQGNKGRRFRNFLDSPGKPPKLMPEGIYQEPVSLARYWATQLGDPITFKGTIPSVNITKYPSLLQSGMRSQSKRVLDFETGGVYGTAPKGTTMYKKLLDAKKGHTKAQHAEIKKWLKEDDFQGG